jgi:uncharacterized protein Yka (UPF0111/DUF47 family)
MRRGGWFLPATPDVLGLLRRQIAVTIEGIDAFAAWAGGDAGAMGAIEDAERRGDVAKRELLTALRAAFVTALEPEDLFALSRGIDWILNHAHDVVSESNAMATPPDAVIARIAALLADAVRAIDVAVAHVTVDGDKATEAADTAIKAEREIERTYFQGMADLLEVEDRSQRIARREQYRRCIGIGETVVDVAERIVYTVVKQG